MSEHKSLPERLHKLHYFLKERDVFLDKSELEEIMTLAILQDRWESNIGHRPERIETNPYERAFHDQWLKENEPRHGINSGNGILQDLFIEHTSPLGGRKYIEVINNRDRYIVATIIQWLGTNVGLGFLHAAFARVNARIGFGTLPEEGPYKAFDYHKKKTP